MDGWLGISFPFAELGSKSNNGVNRNESQLNSDGRRLELNGHVYDPRELLTCVVQFAAPGGVT